MYLQSKLTMRKDSVVVPSTLAPGDYVLGWRWDGSGGNQVIFTPGKPCNNSKDCKMSRIKALLQFFRRNIFWFSVFSSSQVWVSCSSMKLVSAPSARAADDEEYPSLYTDQDYAELEDAFESTRTDDDDDDFEGPVYTDEEYEELEGAFENY